MRRIIAFALSTLLLVSVTSAQQTAASSRQTATPAGNPANTTKLGGGPDTVINCVGAQNGRIPIFTSSLPPNIVICNSGIYEASPYGTGPIGILNPNPIAALDVNGATNTSLYYQIGGGSVVSIGSSPDHNLFLGVGAGATNVSGVGQYNTFTGFQAGTSNTTGCCNTFSGWSAGYSNTTGRVNTIYGYGAGSSSTTGNQNTYLGAGAGDANSTGSRNTFVGWSAGNSNLTGSSNVYIAKYELVPDNESNTIRIGEQGTGLGHQNVTYIAGIYGSTSSSGVPVYVDSDGLLGTMTSSLRFKEQIRDMGDSTSALIRLRPVTFFYKPEYSKGERTLQYGLIAEEVAKLYPELVAYDKDGQPYSVRYQYLTTMLLNEVQKQYRRAEAEAKVIEAQQDQVQSLQKQNQDFQERLSRLEALARVEIANAAK